MEHDFPKLIRRSRWDRSMILLGIEVALSYPSLTNLPFHLNWVGVEATHAGDASLVLFQKKLVMKPPTCQHQLLMLTRTRICHLSRGCFIMILAGITSCILQSTFTEEWSTHEACEWKGWKCGNPCIWPLYAHFTPQYIKEEATDKAFQVNMDHSVMNSFVTYGKTVSVLHRNGLLPQMASQNHMTPSLNNLL